jgi:hypothetical protein
MAQQLIDEGRVFDEHIAEWRESHLGEYVLIKGSSVLGFFPSLDKAFATGTDQFGLEPFFVKQIVPSDTVNVSLFGQRILASR